MRHRRASSDADVTTVSDADDAPVSDADGTTLPPPDTAAAEDGDGSASPKRRHLEERGEAR